ncbi:hypothetical protein A6V36_33160 [Paraburkholderia ginsengiterrae]|uniref:Uncharacterized protein n=1 Tax=Paraburkholderia ginsengiterrae TaxID=1462993 RepID=A0A1A9N5I0_9BURK|nr:hypothetical protein A6V36_33160 [Paraburkholderia ginsengiterrae]OAJ57170.1 hypothetical protein A6V37_29905 [Paraburkholderia ginsengiterrae]
MFRLLSVGAMLLAVASTGVAGEHYVEIWNPPEAQMQPSRSIKPKPRKVAVLPRHASNAAPRRVAEPVAKSLPNTRAAKGPRKAAMPNAADLPRMMTPEGNVLRVHDGGAMVEVVR